MERNAMHKLLLWKENSARKPLIIKGARQVGKTWLMKEFGKKYYKNFVYFNFDEEETLSSVFDNNKNPDRIIELLSLLSGERIEKETTLIILDEVQECSSALNSLKYFFEKANDYHIIVAGSLLGTLLAQPKSYPVGMVNLLAMSPLTFDEFLAVVDKPLYDYYLTIKKGSVVEEIFHKKLLEIFDYYLIIGGMPECVSSWVNNKDPKEVISIQKDLVEIYENDFAKHNGKVNSGRILMVFRSLVSQLAKENSKFIFGVVQKGARAREFENAIEWLTSAGMVNRIYNISKAEHPIIAFRTPSAFKLYLFDTGLLKQMAGIENSFVLLKSDYQFKGALVENFVLQQIKNQFEVDVHYYAENNMEIDFILQHKGRIIPVEVKAGENMKSNSLQKFISENNPKIAIRFSRMGYRTDGNITNIPLYLASKLDVLI